MEASAQMYTKSRN